MFNEIEEIKTTENLQNKLVDELKYKDKIKNMIKKQSKKNDMKQQKYTI